jgi:hypothetical protein
VLLEQYLAHLVGIYYLAVLILKAITLQQPNELTLSFLKGFRSFKENVFEDCKKPSNMISILQVIACVIASYVFGLQAIDPVVRSLP